MGVEVSRLSNGLTVATETLPSVESIALGVWVKSGARNERDDEHGMAHLLEHLLFHGSTHVADPGSEYYRAGARHVNASTDQDFVDCYALLPAANLATGLWIESDRMRFLEPTLSRGDLLKNERSIVKNERRLRLDAGGDARPLADIDTPETHPARCAEEAELGEAATGRLLRWLNAGAFTLESVDRDTDRYDRKLRIVTRGGNSVGDMLVGEGLARRWEGRRRPWC